MVNHEIVTVAVLLVGGDISYVDTEDVAKKADEIAPGRFTWRKYKDQINIENIRAFLSDATKKKNGSYLTGSGKQGWMLTQAGLKFARDSSSQLAGNALARTRQTKDEQALDRWKQKETARLMTSEAFEKWARGELIEVTEAECEAFFRVDEYLVGTARESRVQRVMNVCVESQDPRLIRASEALLGRLRGRE